MTSKATSDLKFELLDLDNLQGVSGFVGIVIPPLTLDRVVQS